MIDRIFESFEKPELMQTPLDRMVVIMSMVVAAGVIYGICSLVRWLSAPPKVRR